MINGRFDFSMALFGRTGYILANERVVSYNWWIDRSASAAHELSLGV